MPTYTTGTLNTTPINEESPFIKNKNEIFYHIINGLLFGAGAFFSSVSTAILTSKLDLSTLLISVTIGFFLGGSVAVTKILNYWTSQEKEYSAKLFNFLP